MNHEAANKGIRCKQLCARSLWRRSKSRGSGNQCLGNQGDQHALHATTKHAYQRWLGTSSSVARPSLAICSPTVVDTKMDRLNSEAAAPMQVCTQEQRYNAQDAASLQDLLRKRFKRCRSHCKCGFHCTSSKFKQAVHLGNLKGTFRISVCHAD